VSVETPNIVWAGAKKGEPPANLPIVTEKDLDGKGEIAPFAEVDFREGTARFGIKEDDRRRHMYLIGRTGTGKTIYTFYFWHIRSTNWRDRIYLYA